MDISNLLENESNKINYYKTSEADCFSESNYAMSMLSTKDTFVQRKNPRSMSEITIKSLRSSSNNDQDIIYKASKFTIKKKKVHFGENQSLLNKIDSN